MLPVVLGMEIVEVLVTQKRIIAGWKAWRLANVSAWLGKREQMQAYFTVDSDCYSNFVIVFSLYTLHLYTNSGNNNRKLLVS